MIRLCTYLALACALGLGSCSGGATKKDQAASKPNVIFVVVDTLRADHTSLGGYHRDTTPNLAERFGEGTVFEAASSASSWTLPSMAMMFTGSFRLGNDGDLRASDKPMGEAFRSAGYRTGAVVANPLLGTYRKNDSLTRKTIEVDPGFQRGMEFFDVEPLSRAHQEHNWYADEIVRRGVSWVDSEPEKEAPFFLWLHLFDPHSPRKPAHAGTFPPLHSEGRAASYKAALPASEEYVLDDDAYRYIESETAKYDEEVFGVDVAMGELFSWLESTGRIENTIVVFTSDHGEGLWNHATIPDEPAKKSNRVPPLYDDHGVQLYSEQVHIPLALVGPGVPRGLRVTDSVSSIDLAPTLYELCNLPFEPAHIGRSLVEAGRFDGQGSPTEVFAICSRSMSLTIDGRWRLHLPAEYRMQNGNVRPELFDLEADPKERNPIADEALIEAMSARIVLFRESLETGPVADGGRSLAEEEARRELLDALGYIDQ
jgi:arylsulfatase A-like enzyme